MVHCYSRQMYVTDYDYAGWQSELRADQSAVVALALEEPR